MVVLMNIPDMRILEARSSHRWLVTRSSMAISGLSSWQVFRMSAVCLAVKSSAAESRPLSHTTLG